MSLTKIAGSRTGSVSQGYGTDLRIRIHTKMSRFRNTGFVCVLFDFTQLLVHVCRHLDCITLIGPGLPINVSPSWHSTVTLCTDTNTIIQHVHYGTLLFF